MISVCHYCQEDSRSSSLRVKRRTADRASATVKTIAFLGLPGTQILDITGPFQVFVRAAEIYLRSHPRRKHLHDSWCLGWDGSRTGASGGGSGPQIALEVARELVMYMRRAGGQSQFSTAVALQTSDRKQIEELRCWAADHLCSDLRVENLADRARMSPKNVARVFAKERGITPARFIEKIRVESGRRRLEESRDDLEKIARDCGLGSVQALRRSFLRVMRVAPSVYRRRFSNAV
jgi:AraC-like DNA-binding protein